MKKYALLAGAPVLAASLLLAIAPFSRWTSPLEAQPEAEPPVKGEVSGGYTLKVEIEGIPQAALRVVESLEVTTEVIEVKDDAHPSVLRKLPGRTAYGNIRLKFDPLAAGDALWEWYGDVLREKVTRKEMSIILSTRDGKEARRYKFSGTWPCKWEGPRQDGSGEAAAAEEVTIAYERVERLKS